MAQQESPPAVAPDEAANLLAYRIDRFQRQGFSEREALRLIDAGADHHDVQHMLDHGCDRPTVLRIRG